MTIFGLQARATEVSLQRGRGVKTDGHAEEPEGVSFQLSRPHFCIQAHSLTLVSKRFPSILSTVPSFCFFCLFVFAHVLCFLLCTSRTPSNKGGDSHLLKAHLLSCLDFPVHATPRRRHGNHHRHFMAKEPQATGQPSRSPRKGGGL